MRFTVPHSLGELWLSPPSRSRSLSTNLILSLTLRYTRIVFVFPVTCSQILFCIFLVVFIECHSSLPNKYVYAQRSMWSHSMPPWYIVQGRRLSFNFVNSPRLSVTNGGATSASLVNWGYAAPQPPRMCENNFANNRSVLQRCHLHSSDQNGKNIFPIFWQLEIRSCRKDFCFSLYFDLYRVANKWCIFRVMLQELLW